MDDETIEPSRMSSLNRTMVLTKRGTRPGLPKINNEDDTISEPIGVGAPQNLEAERVHFRPTSTGGCGGAVRSRVRSATVTISSATMDEFQREFEEVDKSSMPESEKLTELKRRVLALVDAKEKQWNAQSEAAAKENNSAGGQSALSKLEMEIARKAAMYADKFFQICERNEINIEKVLQNDPEMIFSMKLRSALPTPSTAVDLTKEIEVLKKERDNLADETKGLKASYSNLFKSYDALRKNYERLQESRNEMIEKTEMQKTAMNTIYESDIQLKSVVAEQAAMADQTIAETKGNYDAATVTIRMDLVKLQNESTSLKSEIESKNREIDELRLIIQEIIKNVQLEAV